MGRGMRRGTLLEQERGLSFAPQLEAENPTGFESGPNSCFASEPSPLSNGQVAKTCQERQQGL